MKKLLVVGLDGATFNVLDRYVRREPHGTLARMRRSGTVRVLESTLPFFTGPAWTTFMTGLRPDQHGVYHWRGRYDPQRGSRPLISTRHLDEASFWWYVQQHGGQVSITNFPMTYPAPPTDGVFICGTLSMEDAPGQTWPPQLGHQLKESIPGYRYEIASGLSMVDQPSRLREHILQVGANHLAGAVRFGRVGEADLAVHVVTITDRMQHFFWEQADDPSTNVFDAYALADQALDALLLEGNWDNVIVLSDHGAGPTRWVFNTDEWLVAQDFAREGDDNAVDVPHSLAYAGEEPEVSLYVNRADREGFGVPEAEYGELLRCMRSELLAMRIPGNGNRAFRRVILAEEIYNGRLRDLGPDLILVPTEGVHPRPGLSGSLFGEAGGLVSGHRIEGIFLASGLDFKESPDRVAWPPLQMAEIFSLLCVGQGLAIPGGIPVSPLLYQRQISHQIDGTLDWPQHVNGVPPRQADSPDMLQRLTEMGYL